MHPLPRWSFVFLPLLALPAAAAQEGARGLFTRLSDSGPRGVVELALGAQSYARFDDLSARGASVELADLPLPGGLDAHLFLRPVSAMEPGARAQVVEADGSVTWLAPQARCFSGFVQGGGEAFLGLTPQGLEGYVRAAGELYFLSSGGSSAGRATLAHASQVDLSASSFCQLAGGRAAERGDAGSQRAVAGSLLRTADVFIEADNVFRGLFPSSQACADYSALLLTAASEVYRRDLGVRLNIPNGYLRVWNTTPPWGVTTTFGDLNQIQAYWTSNANPNRNLPRAAVQVLTTPVFGGVAWAIGGICQPTNGYELSSVTGHFPYPRHHTDNDNWDLFVVTHEFGHSFGCIHAFDFQPPIQCQDGSGPDSGTIMSYCHLSFGTGAVGMRFHLREQLRIRDYVTTVDCLTNLPLIAGDYDADGARDADDLLVANGILAQGFRSLGAEEVLDMDGDGDFDAADRDVLALSLSSLPASATMRNGSGVNPECLISFGSNPVLGRQWNPQVVAFGFRHPTVIWIHDAPHAGLPTPYGELLVRPGGLGGVRLLTSIALSDGSMATHRVPIPSDLSLTGRSATAQGIIVGAPGGTRLCNALDLVLSPFD